MKKLSFLLAMIALPAWAADTAPTAERGMSIELKGPAPSVSALVADLEKNAAYKDAGCAARTGKAGKKARIACARADGALLTALGGSAPADVRWTISSAMAVGAPAAPLGCPVGCSYMRCPPPSGPAACCNTTTLKVC